jgi:glycerophosphoryl diester phosphodiesterase
LASFTHMLDLTTPLVIAHRGASEAAHENTLAAFEMAIEMKADAVEMDVRRTADGMIVVHHNQRVRRSRSPLSKSTFAHSLMAARKAGYRLPTLEEALKLCQGRIAVDIELKERGYEEAVCELVTDYFESDHVIIKSFFDSVVTAVKRTRSDLAAGLLLGSGSRLRKKNERTGVRAETRLRRCGADFVSPHFSLARKRFIERMHDLGLPVLVWTVDDKKRAVRLASRGVQAIITNKPDQMIDALRQR